MRSAYNLGNLIREEPTSRGLFYFCACFFPLQSLWQYKMYWDSRFYIPSRDMYHEFFELCTLVALGTAVLNIRPVSLLSNPEENIDLFLFCLSISIAMLLIMGRPIEVMVLIEDEPSAVIASKRDATMYAFMTVFFAAATIFAGVKYFGGHKSAGSYYDSPYGADASYSDSSYDTYNKTSSHAEDDHHLLFRFLAGVSSYSDSESHYSGDVSMGLMLGGFCVNHVFWFLLMVIVLPRAGGGDHRR